MTKWLKNHNNSNVSGLVLKISVHNTLELNPNQPKPF